MKGLELAAALALSGVIYMLNVAQQSHEARQIASLEERGFVENNKTRRLRKNSDSRIGWYVSVAFLFVWIVLVPSPFNNHGMRVLQLQIGAPVAVALSMILWGVVSGVRFSHFDKHDSFAGRVILQVRDGQMHRAAPQPPTSIAKGSAQEDSAVRVPGMIDPEANRGISA